MSPCPAYVFNGRSYVWLWKSAETFHPSSWLRVVEGTQLQVKLSQSHMYRTVLARLFQVGPWTDCNLCFGPVWGLCSMQSADEKMLLAEPFLGARPRFRSSCLVQLCSIAYIAAWLLYRDLLSDGQSMVKQVSCWKWSGA
jgi:hypothetical protein